MVRIRGFSMLSGLPTNHARLPRTCHSYSTAANSILQHHHLKSTSPNSFVRYDDAESLQEKHRSHFLTWKALSESERAHTPCPKPSLISFTSTPTYTLGRRQDALTADQTSQLRFPLTIGASSQTFTPDIRKTNRGGLTTYHGPGQIVLWPVLDMHSPLYAKYGVASYAAHLEATTRRLLMEKFGIKTYTNRDEPGVWVETASGQERKIAALGVHHRRYVTALGIAVNINVPVTGSGETNPWARFVPCGLEGKLVTSAAAETGNTQDEYDLEGVAVEWARIFEEGLMNPDKRVYH